MTGYYIWATLGHLSYLLLQKESTRQDSPGGRIQQIRQDNTSLIPCEAILWPGQISFKYRHLKLNFWQLMSNKWNKVLEAESISKCNQQLPFSSTPRKEVFSFGRRSSQRNCEKQCVGDFRVQHNVQCMSRLRRIFTKYFPTTEQKSQAKWMESFYAHHNILTQRILHCGIVERFVTNWNVKFRTFKTT